MILINRLPLVQNFKTNAYGNIKYRKDQIGWQVTNLGQSHK